MAPNKVFPFLLSSDSNHALKVDEVDNSLLWHMRYGHLNYKSLKVLKEKDMVVGLPNVHCENKVCEGCIYGKFHRLPFNKTSWRAKAPLDLVHADICGPTRTPSLRKKIYFLLFVDDFTRHMWVYILEQKLEAFSAFLQFKAMWRNKVVSS